MFKPELDEAGYIAEANARLRAHPDFHNGLRFTAYPDGAMGSDIQGFAMVGFPNKPYNDVSQSMHADFDVRLTLRR